tara:strand:+ start:1326 stop:2147 length:822 start_codon:yes stop_codon:yes gene_type:complete
MFVRLNLIILPLFKIYRRYTKQGMIKLILSIKKEAKISGIEGFILRELVLFGLPLSVILVLRYFILGQPIEPSWNVQQIIGSILCASLWFGIEVRGSIRTRRALEPFGASKFQWSRNPRDWFGNSELEQASTLANPKLLKGAWMTRQKLVDFSNWHVDYIDSQALVDESISDENVFYKTDAGKILIDGDILKAKVGNLAIKSASAAKNVHSKIKEGIKNVSGYAVNQIDSSIQEAVDNVTQRTKISILGAYLSNFALLFGPILWIYQILPILS